MQKIIGRREFMARGAKVGIASVLVNEFLAKVPGGLWAAPAAAAPDIAVAAGGDYGAAAFKAVELAGGMSKFIKKGAKVALLPNVQSRHPGTFTKPEIFRAVIRMCRDAGAGEVAALSLLTQQHWDGAGLSQIAREESVPVKLIPAEDIHYRPVPVPRAAAFKEAMVPNDFFNYDAYINMPVTKDHAGNRFTGTLKNHMGLNSRAANRSFHKPKWKTDPADIEHLEICIVDLNTIFKPALNIVDATEIITTNGPMGPGELIKPMKVAAGLDRVAIDAYCAALLGLEPRDVLSIRKSAERGLGEIDLRKVKVQEVRV
ncbi:MAG: hypothetical protein A2W03_18510 [Candidatus Aminicenantes bacterium RBG_16_63_16]|nr:MAG: hypothetical protein A2W03_18510 [Candidatus Aminicenantes bacterium RBG_16_63_16]